MNEIWIEIPRIYTAVAEWMACMIFILMIERRHDRIRTALLCAVAYPIQVEYLSHTGSFPIYLWIPCMIGAWLMMCGLIGLCCKVHWREALYYGAAAFLISEFIASFEWQIVSYLSKTRVPTFVEAKVLVFLVYNAVSGLLFILLREHVPHDGDLQLDDQELIGDLLVMAVVFGLSNFSFLSIETPFTSNDHFQICNIRTFVDMGGVAILYAQLLRSGEINARREIEALQSVLQNQYIQYKQSREAVDLINYKYHDLKHQIAYLRSEEDPDKRAAYLQRMEDEIRQYDAQNKTGNKVLDTILTSKSLYCAKHGITMTCVADGTLLDFMDVMDICSIFGNALDNAIECELKIADKEQRLIHVTVAAQKAFLLLRFENYYEEAPVQSGGTWVTSKEDKTSHGYGIKSIAYTVERYGGAMDIETQDHWFTLRILIPMQAEETQ